MRNYPGQAAQYWDTPRARALRPIRDQEKPRLNAELEALRHRYIQELDRLYGGEQEHLHVLPAMAVVAQRPALKDVFQYHCEKTQAQLERLDQICAGLGLRPVRLSTRPATPTRPWPITPAELAGCDDVLITAARQMEQREIAGYLLALNCAQILREPAAVTLLEQTLQEEYEADLILATLEASQTGRLREKPEPTPASQAERA